MTRNLARVWGVITLVSGCEKKPAAEPLSERECIVEFFLFMGLFATRPVRRVLLCLGIGLHLAIMLFMGLTNFSVTVFAALILYLRPTDEPFSLGGLAFALGSPNFGGRDRRSIKRAFQVTRARLLLIPFKHEPSHEAADCV